jgi:DNA ligase-3
MSDSTKFSTDYSKRVSKCQKCKMELAKGSVRLAKVQPNFFQDGEGEMKNYFHFQCLFETFKRARATTKVIESADDVDGFSELTESDKKSIIELIDGEFLNLCHTILNHLCLYKFKCRLTSK